MTKEREFESMLASGETWKLSETADIARSDSLSPTNDAIQQDLTPSSSGKRRPIADMSEGPESRDDEDVQRTPTSNAQSFQVVPSMNPQLPPRAFERSSSSNIAQSPSSASGFSNLELSPHIPEKNLPVHPHHRSERSQNDDKLQSLDSSRTPSPSGKSIKQMLGPSVQVRPPLSSASSSTSGQGKIRSRAPQQLPNQASPAFSSSSQATFTGPRFKSDPNAPEAHYLHLESGSSNAALSEKNVSALKQKLKKTGGFLKRLGGGSSAEKSQMHSPRTSKIVRKPSQNSIGSDGGISIANSTKSAPGEYQSRWEKETKVPVPSIPTRFKESTSGENAQRKENEKRLGSSPFSGLPASTSEESQASSQGLRNRGIKTPSTTSGSAGSATTEMRHALKAWEKEMDATLQQSGQDLEEKTKIEKPSRFWTPGPQLPEYRLNRKSSFMDEGDESEREVRLLQSSTPDESSPGQIGTSTYDPQHLVPVQPQRAASLGMGLPSSVAPQTSIIHSDPLVPTSEFPSSPQREFRDDFGSRFRRGGRPDNTSYASARSFETAIDRPSYFVGHSHRNEPSSAKTIVPERAEVEREAGGQTSDENMDPERSIRLITNTSTDTDVSTIAAQKSDQTHSPGLASINDSKHKHVKEKTVTQHDENRRSAFPAANQIKESKLRGETAVDQSVDAAAKGLALKCWNEDETFKRREKIAEWLGGTSLIQQLARRHYMDQFDLAGLRIDATLRKLCDKLFLRAETQQVDRILSALSQRYFECNSQNIFVNADVIHALVFSILLLNTDLHVADIQDRMTRNQFVRNTLSAIMESSEVSPTQLWTNGGSGREEEVMSRSSLNDASAGVVSSDSVVSAQSTTPSSRLTPLTPLQRASNDDYSIAGSDAARLASDITCTPFSKTWEAEMESLLRDIYTAVKTDQIRLPITDTSSLSAFVPRKPLRAGPDRVNALKRGSIRGIQGLLAGNANILRSDDNLSASRSSLNSTNRSFSDYNATPMTSMTSGSLSGPPPTLGFANTLSQSIIKEAKDEEDSRSIDSVNDDLTDDDLALMGPPWAKEGMLTRKHYWEASMKRAKDKAWTDCFVVVQKGMFSMFRFGDSNANGGGSYNTTSKKTAADGLNVGIGGGNWLSNATCIGEYPLAHTLANSLPPPGYNRQRPHVFALTLPNGSVFFFQTGHEELVQEWVSTCNYWAARQSREPLAGGVSNMDYGWNKVLPRDDQDDDDATSQSHSDATRPSLSHNNSSDARSIRSGKSSKSLRMRVGRNGMFQSWQSGADRISAAGLSSPTPSSLGGSALFSSTPERPVYINEWRAPTPPTVCSNLSEEDQLEACKRHKTRVEAELTEHNTLRQPMLDYFASIPNMPASSITKAVANFDRKATYLLSDLTKFTLYTAILASANKLKMEKRDARQLHRMMLKADEELSRVKAREEGPPVQA